MGELVAPALHPLLGKETFKSDGMISIKLGNKIIEYSKFFELYMTTKLPNPAYKP